MRQSIHNYIQMDGIIV